MPHVGFLGEVPMRYYTRIRKTYKTGDMIFTENSACDGMYIIDSGKVRVYKTLGKGADRKEVELCRLGPKAMFGEMAMIDEKHRSASVAAVEPTVCTVITKQIFEDQLAHIPPWMVNMIRILVSRLRETNERLRKMVEEHTATPVDDAGSILTVDADGEENRVSTARREQCTGSEEPKAGSDSESAEMRKGKRFQSEEIIRSLFDR
ncbi:MAG: cyclic nucleotide-binding domain-containing protein [Chitinivibrionales bacterium]|nr:cyclic nucleotide-binding domain-containing protein [Chitinivibrionales bacterium]MBD3357690.1 cyclic nucleotide-binding domain-containing protein [Chitinivibrionales bacterium]